jgi:hypothetical protein
MTPEQQAMQTRRLFLEEQVWTNEKYLSDLKRGCKEHVIIRGRIIFSPAKGKVVNTHEGLPENWNDGCYSVSCAVCGQDFGWHCPVNPKGYCEYKGRSGDCIFCGISSERK